MGVLAELVLGWINVGLHDDSRFGLLCYRQLPVVCIALYPLIRIVAARGSYFLLDGCCSRRAVAISQCIYVSLQSHKLSRVWCLMSMVLSTRQLRGPATRLITISTLSSQTNPGVVRFEQGSPHEGSTSQTHGYFDENVCWMSTIGVESIGLPID